MVSTLLMVAGDRGDAGHFHAGDRELGDAMSLKPCPRPSRGCATPSRRRSRQVAAAIRIHPGGSQEAVYVTRDKQPEEIALVEVSHIVSQWPDRRATEKPDFPVHCTAPSAPTNLIHHHAVDTNQPIGCGDVPVFPGDIVVADEDGVAKTSPTRHRRWTTLRDGWRSKCVGGGLSSDLTRRRQTLSRSSKNRTRQTQAWFAFRYKDREDISHKWRY